MSQTPMHRFDTNCDYLNVEHQCVDVAFAFAFAFNSSHELSEGVALAFQLQTDFELLAVVLATAQRAELPAAHSQLVEFASERLQRRALQPLLDVRDRHVVE